MKKLTAIFLEALGKETGQRDRAAALASKSMQEEFARKTAELLSAGTLFFSDQGRELRQNLVMLRERIGRISNANEAVGTIGRLNSLYIEAERLHRETQKQIHRPGHIDAGKLHFFYRSDQQEALEILEQYNRAELYRIIALGGGSAFLTRKPLKSYQHNLQERVRYLREEISPVTETVMFRELADTRYWAVQHNDNMRVGPMGILPGFVMTAPVKTDHRFIPGEHRMLPYRKGVVLQGVGYLTNVTPLNVEEAQRRGALVTEVRPEQLLPYLNNLQEPDGVLRHLFTGRYYVISPEQYFAAASYAEASLAVIRRKRMGQCVLCGKLADAGSFCEGCGRRIKIV